MGFVTNEHIQTSMCLLHIRSPTVHYKLKVLIQHDLSAHVTVQCMHQQATPYAGTASLLRTIK